MKSYLNDYKLLTGCDQPIKIQTHNKNSPNSSNLRLIINAIRINGYVSFRPIFYVTSIFMIRPTYGKISVTQVLRLTLEYYRE